MPTDTTQRVTTIAEQVRQTPAINEAIDALTSELEQRQAELTDIRPAAPELKGKLDEYIKRCEQSRGRGPMLPYVGSGFGAGALVELLDGSVKFDMTCGIGPNFFGHSDPELTGVAMRAAMDDVVMQGYFQQNYDSITFTETLVNEAKKCSRLAHGFLTTSGAMANEAALKVCFQKNFPASRALAFSGCFMGRSLAMSCIGDNPAYRVGLPYVMDVDYVPFYDEAAARRAGGGDLSGQTREIDLCVSRLREHLERHPKQHVCFVMELVQGEGGYNTAPREYFKALMDVCKAHGVAVWADEIQTFGRTGKMFCFDHYGLGEMIDVCTVGKMTQVCAALYTADYNPKPGLLSGTFLGGSVALQVGQRMIERLRDGGYYGPSGRIAKHREAFERQARALARKRPEWFPADDRVPDIVGGLGGMMRLTPFGGDKDKVFKLLKVMFEEGVVALYCGHGPHHVRLLPPLGVMPEAQWARVFELIEKALARTAA